MLDCTLKFGRLKILPKVFFLGYQLKKMALLFVQEYCNFKCKHIKVRAFCGNVQGAIWMLVASAG